MFDVEKFIDVVQDGKKQIVGAAFKQSGILDPVNQIIDAQTAYTKVLVNSMTKLNKAVSEETSRASEMVQSGLGDLSGRIAKSNDFFGWTTSKPKTK